MNYVFFACGLLLAGCAPAIQPGAPVLQRIALPETLIRSSPAVQSVDQPLPEMWWHEFHDPNLDQLVQLALSGNPGLAEANARLRLAQASVMRSAALTSPHVDSSNQVTRLLSSKYGNHDIYNGKTATVANVDPLMVSYHLDFWNRDSEIIAASRDAEQEARAQFRQSALMLSSAVIKTCFALNTARQLVSSQKAIVTIAAEESRLRNAAYQAGIQPASPALAQNADLLDAQNALAVLQERAAALHFALLELLGKAPGDVLAETALKIDVPSRFSIPQRIDLDLVAQRPDIQAALWSIKRHAHLEKVAQVAFYPNINLYALAGFNSIGLQKLLTPGGFTYAFGPAIDLPLFEAGALAGKLHETEAAYDVAVHTYNRTLLAALRQIADALAALQYSRIQLDNRIATRQLRMSQARIAESGFRSGVAGKLPYLEDTIRMNRENMSHMEENLHWLNCITDTATALGGGFGSWPA